MGGREVREVLIVRAAMRCTETAQLPGIAVRLETQVLRLAYLPSSRPPCKIRAPPGGVGLGRARRIFGRRRDAAQGSAVFLLLMRRGGGAGVELDFAFGTGA